MIFLNPNKGRLRQSRGRTETKVKNKQWNDNKVHFLQFHSNENKLFEINLSVFLIIPNNSFHLGLNLICKLFKNMDQEAILQKIEKND